MPSAAPSFDDLSARLLGALASTIPGVARVENLARLSGGANQETWAFDAVAPDGTHPLILRRAPGGGSGPGAAGAMPLEVEAALVAAVGRHGAPVPRVVATLSPADGLGSGFVMNRIEGETVAPRILRDDRYAAARPRLASQCGAILAKIHSTPLDGIEGLASLSTAELLARHRDSYDGYDRPRPVFELAFRWLRERVEEPPARALVHGDFRNGNLIVGEEGVRAALDWELAHVGDPMEDLGWICVASWRFGAIDKPVGGFGEREDLYRAYEEAGGVVRRDRVRFWEMFGTLKWGLACMSMCETYRSGRDRSLERAAVGRRASETEIDLLRLLREDA